MRNNEATPPVYNKGNVSEKDRAEDLAEYVIEYSFSYFPMLLNKHINFLSTLLCT